MSIVIKSITDITALAFKNEQMAKGTKRKEAVNNTKTVEELKDI